MTRPTRAFAFAFALGASAPVLAEDDFAARWVLRVGHSYSSTSALLQPATFVVSSDLGRPALTLFDVGVLARGPLGAQGGLDVGARHAGGSGRSNERRRFTAIVRGWHRWNRLIVAGDTEYEASGDFGAQNGVLGVEATVTHGPRGLGQPWSPSIRLRWRPWIGFGAGTVLATEAESFGPEAGAFWRGHARIEVHYAVGAIEAIAGDTRAPRAELNLEATGWLLFDDSSSEGLVRAAIAIPLAGGFSASASTDLGRQPPEFELERRVGLGLGFRY